MSGIVGLWNLDGSPVERHSVGIMSATLAHRGPDGERLWVRGPVGFGSQLLRVTPEALTEIQPVIGTSGAVIVFDGRLDNRSELLDGLGSSARIDRNAPDPVLVLAAYEAFGERCPEHLLGDFAFAVFDSRLQQLLLARDAIGMRPLHYAHVGNMFLFASEVKAILAHPGVTAIPHNEHLAQYLLGGSPQDDELWTFFRDIKSVRPGYELIVKHQRIDERSYWDFATTRQIRLASFEEYAEGFRHYFEQAVQRRLRSSHPIAVSLSGGLDSSSIFCAAERSRNIATDLVGISYTSPSGSPSDEDMYVQDIEHMYRVQIDRLPLIVGGLLTGARETVWHADSPILGFHQSTHDLIHEAARKRDARVWLTGHWGDELVFDYRYLIDLFGQGAWLKIWRHLHEYNHWYTDLGNSSWLRRAFLKDLVRHHIPDFLIPMARHARSRLGGSNKWDNPCFTDLLRQNAYRPSRLPIDKRRFASAHSHSIYNEVRSTQHVLYMEWSNKVAARHGLEHAAPFLDRDLVAYIMAIPGEMQSWRGVPRAILRQAMRGVIPESIALRRWKADITDSVTKGLQSDLSDLRSVLRPDGMAVRLGFLRGDMLASELNRIRDENDNTGIMARNATDLLALELWLNAFCSKRSQTPTPHRMVDNYSLAV